MTASVQIQTQSDVHDPQSTQEEFSTLVRTLVESFPTNATCRKLDSGAFGMDDYHFFLNMIFHQTFVGPSTFSLAGGQCDHRRFELRDYLMEHAEEERSHWRWVIEDLQNTGFAGPDPRSRFPYPACQRFVAFNTYCAVRMPAARLGNAAFLEGVGAAYGKKYAQKICACLDLKPQQVKFVFGHGDTDVGHFDDIVRVLSESTLSSYEWAWLCHAVKVNAGLYREMLDEVSS